MWSTIPHHGGWFRIPLEIRPHVGAALAAGLADKPRLYVGHIISLSALDLLVPTGKWALPGAYFGDGDNCSMQLRR
jgi:hypothetical protein